MGLYIIYHLIKAPIDEICSVELKLKVIYIFPNNTIQEIIRFLHKILLTYTIDGAIILRKNLNKIFVIFGSNFNTNVAMKEAQILINFNFLQDTTKSEN